MYAAVSPVAARLIQALTTISSPPALLAPSPPGITQRRWALTSSAVGKKPAAGAEALAGGVEGRGRNLRGGGKNKDGRRQEKEEKVEGEVCGGHLSHSLSYTKVPNVPVIPQAEVGLRAEE